MSGITSTALVRFKDARRLCYVCHVSSIKNFSPKHSKDFHQGSDYSIKWEKSFVDGDERHSGWYDAEIILLGASENEVRLKAKKLPFKIKICGVIPRALPEACSPQSKSSKRARGSHHNHTSSTSSQQRKSNHREDSSLGASSKTKDLSRRYKSDPRDQVARDNPSFEELLAMYKQQQLPKTTGRKATDSEMNAMVSGFGQEEPGDLNLDASPDGDGESPNMETGTQQELSAIHHVTAEKRPAGNDSESLFHEEIEEEDSDHLTDEEGVTNKVISDLKGETKLPIENGKVILGKNCKLRQEMWDLRVRPAKSVTYFVRNLALGLWGSKKLRKRTLTGHSRSSIEKKKATPRKKECIMAAAKGYLKYKNTAEAAIPLLLEKAQATLGKKMTDTGRQNDPEYRAKVKLWNQKARERKVKQVKKKIVFESEGSDSD